MNQAYHDYEILATRFEIPSDLLSKLIVFWLQVFTVTTPRCVELNQDVFCFIHDDVFEVVADDHLHRAIIGFRYRLALQVVWDLACHKLGHECI